ncbi:MAG: PDZ domain-containing protein [Acidobacteria bacterium]|nr:PDZ domain-containing protein [Acidobacteriota bacterium]
MDLQRAQRQKYIAVLALAACLILGFGWVLRPSEIPNSPAPLPTENEMAQLARRAERRSLDSMVTYFAVTASDVESSVVYLPGAGTSGVVWGDGTVVTAPLLQQEVGTVTIQSRSGQDRGQPTIWGPLVPLAAVALGEGLAGVSTARADTSIPEAGTWVLAVWRAGRDRGFAPGTYLQSASVTCGQRRLQEVVSSLALNSMMVGGGVFDIDGGLLAVMLPCGDRIAAIATSSVAAILTQADTTEQRVLARYGLALGALSDDEAAYFELSDGVIVREVWAGYRGEEAGLLPGDIIAALDGAVVAVPRDLEALEEPAGEEPAELSVRRGTRTLTIALPRNDTEGDSAAAATRLAGLVWDAPPPPYRIEGVVPGSRAAAAGIEPGDRLVRIDHVAPRSRAQVQRIFADTRTLPVLLDIERGERRIAVLVR